MQDNTNSLTLDKLLHLMKHGTLEDWLAAGLPIHGDRLDWTDLPIFGGDEPRDTSGIWSWDRDRLLIGTCSRDIEIVPREFLDRE